jgi:hypothetical protein
MLMTAMSIARGQETNKSPTISPDRPGQSTPPDILLPGYLQVEAGLQLTGDKAGAEGAGMTRTLSLPGLLVRIGMLTSMELRFSTEFRSVKTTIPGSTIGPITISESDTTSSGLAGLWVGTKIGITQENGAVPETAFLLTLGLPEIGSKSFRPVAVAPDFMFLMRNALSNSVSLYYDIGASWDGVTPAGTGLYTLSLGAAFSERLSGFAEVYGSLKTGVQPLHAADAGVAFLTAGNLQLDLSGGVGISENAPDYFISAGISLRLPR